jgi:hypothetical protein
MNKVAVGLLVIIAALAGSAGPVPAWEHRGHRAFVHGFWGPRVFLGPPAFWYPYTLPPVIVEAAPGPQVSVQPPPAAPQYWYYCESPRGYYPYVPQCPGGWLEVVPRTGPPAS